MSDLLERNAELAILARVAASARSGSGEVFVIEGPAGIGKTRLAENALASATATGLEAASARASELEHDFPFGVVRQLLEPLVRSVPDADRADVLSGPASLAAAVLSEPGRVASTSATEISYATLHGLYWLTADLAARTPLMIVVDDAHWCDAPSLRYLSYLARRIEGVPCSVVLVQRPAEPGAEAELLEEIASGSAAERLKLPPLSESAVMALVRARLSQEADERFCAACHRATKGNPFLLRELMLTLAEEGTRATREESVRVSNVAPDTVARWVVRRLERLPDSAGAVARAVAVLGDESESQVVARLAGLDDVTTAEASEELARVDIFRRGGRPAFAHPIVRAAIDSNLSPAGRTRAHRQAAHLLAAQGADIDRIAMHVMATEPSCDPGAADVLREAGRAAVSRGAPDVGAAYLQRALREPLPDDIGAELLVELGLAEVAAVPPPAGIEHIRQALALTGDVHKRSLVSLELGRALLEVVDFEGATEVLEGALVELGGTDAELAERLEALLMAALMMRLSTAPRALRRLDQLLADASAGQLKNPMLLAEIAVLVSFSHEPAAEGAKLAERALSGGRAIADRDQVTLTFATAALTFANRQDSVLQIWDEALGEARRSGSMPLFAYASAFRSHTAWRMGSLAVAEGDARAALNVRGLRAAQYGLSYAVMALVDVLIEQGELDAAAQAIAENGISGPLPELLQLNFVLESRGRLRLAQRRPREALDDFLECGRRLEGWGARNPAVIPWRSSAATALEMLGERDRALQLVREEIELARRFEVPRELGMALRVAGLIEGGPHGIVLVQQAVTVLERSSAALERARALTDLGGAIRRSGRRADARDLLRRGLDGAQRCGAKALADRAYQELLAAGGRPRRKAASGIDALTASERRVVELAAEGMRNREIAQALFVTEKTVEWHLGQAYRKLDVRSRSELPEIVAGRGRHEGVGT